MKQLLTSFLLAAALCLSAEWNNSLRPKGKASAVDLSEFTAVVTSKNPDEREKFAAKTLQDIWPKMTGSQLSLVKTGAPAQGKTIRFCGPDTKLGDEGYRIAVENGNIVLTGGLRRSVINAVIALLEEDFGVRWYAPKQPPRVPEIKGKTSIVPRSYQPHLFIREPFYASAFDPMWEIYNRTNQSWQTWVQENLGGAWNFPKGAFCHTFDRFLPQALFKEHPEYFALIDGKRQAQQPGKHAAHLCMSNPEVVKIVAKNAVDFLRKEKNPPEIISISQNDGGKGFCTCEKCLAMTEAEGSVSGPLLNFVNQVADLIHKDYPDIKVETLAYLESFNPPKTVRPGKNVLIRLCTDSHAWKYPLFFVEESGTFYKALQEWHKIGANLLIWDYVVDFKNYPMPDPNLQVMDHAVDVYLRNGACGIMLQGAYQSPGGADDLLKSWIFAKRFWNSEWKLEPLLDDFLEGYFGKAAPLFREYYAMQKAEWQKFHDAWKGKKLPVPGPVFQFSPEFIWKSRVLLDQAFKVAASDPALTEKIRREEFNWLYMRLTAGPRDEKDMASFKQDLEKFKEEAKEFKVTRYKEASAKGQMEDKELEFKCRIADTFYRKVPEGGFRFCAHNVNRLWPAGEQTACRIEENDRVILAQKGKKPAWSMQWKLAPDSFAPGMKDKVFVPGQKYKLVAKCRVDAASGNGPLFLISTYDHSKKSYQGTIHASANSFKGKEWTVLEGPAFIPSEEAILYVSPAKGELLDTLYIDNIQLVPVK